MMRNRDLVKQYQSIKRLIDGTAKSTHDDLELQGHWGRYLCVLVSGFIENAISEVYIDFVEQAASPHVTQYARKTLNKIRNPKSEKFQETAYRFKKEWGESLYKYFQDDPSVKNAVDSIMANRHLIVHGKPCNITVHRVREYLDKAVKLVAFIENQCANRT